MQETEDIVTRLRAISGWRKAILEQTGSLPSLPCIKAEAADRIEADAATIATLRAEVEGLRADAERYRFLRNECSGEPRFGEVAPTIVLFGLQGKAEGAWCEAAVATNHLTDTIDAAIDAAKADKEGA